MLHCVYLLARDPLPLTPLRLSVWPPPVPAFSPGHPAAPGPPGRQQQVLRHRAGRHRGGAPGGGCHRSQRLSGWVHARTHTCTHMYTQVHTHSHTHMYTQVHAYVCTRAHLHTSKHTCTRTHTHTMTHIKSHLHVAVTPPPVSQMVSVSSQIPWHRDMPFICTLDYFISLY